MPRNRSEKRPFPQLSRLFHERLRLWAIHSIHRTSASEDTWQAAYDEWEASDDSMHDEEIDDDEGAFDKLLKFYLEQYRATQPK